MFQTIKANRISDEIVNQIKEALFDGKLRAGDRLPTERELAEQFETSRASVREALRGLEQEGVIQIKKGMTGGIFVIDMGHQPVANSLHTLLRLRRISIDNITEARLILEPEAARLAAERASEEDISELEEVIEKMRVTVANNELPGSYDLMFHKLIARAAMNPVIEMLSNSMFEVTARAITEIHPGIDTLRHVVERHRDVFEAIRSRDPELAFKAMHAHIVDVQGRLVRQARSGEAAE